MPRQACEDNSDEDKGSHGVRDAPIVLTPSGSTCLANCRESEFARSELQAVTARMMQVSMQMYSRIISRMRCSMSAGWSPTGTRVIPGRSTRVIVLAENRCKIGMR